MYRMPFPSENEDILTLPTQYIFSAVSVYLKWSMQYNNKQGRAKSKTRPHIHIVFSIVLNLLRHKSAYYQYAPRLTDLLIPAKSES